jgi:outer membrane protein OmpA-like peptidoglycan-associated protein
MFCAFRRGWLVCGVVAAAALLPVSASAQFGSVLRKAKQKVENKVDQKVDRALDQAVACAFDDAECQARAKADGKAVTMTDRDGTPVTNADGTPVSSPAEARSRLEEPGTGVWRNYDFVPGDSVLMATDWTGERVGRFPASQLEFVSGNLEIVDRGGVKLLETRGRSDFQVVLPNDLPAQFTLEFNMEVTSVYKGVLVTFEPLNDRAPHTLEATRLGFEERPGIYQGGRALSTTETTEHEGALTPIRVQVDGNYAVVYIGSHRIAQVPNAKFPRTRVIEFTLDGSDDAPIYLSDIVVRAGLDPLYDKLMADGAVTSYGFLFDVDSDRLRPESTPKLDELRQMLADHADLGVTIEGHTDGTGAAQHNQELSLKRAESVVRYLTEAGIDAGRLHAAGKGASEPIGDNGTAVGRQQNRRVVIRKAS